MTRLVLSGAPEAAVSTEQRGQKVRHVNHGHHEPATAVEIE